MYYCVLARGCRTLPHARAKSLSFVLLEIGLRLIAEIAVENYASVFIYSRQAFSKTSLVRVRAGQPFTQIYGPSSPCSNILSVISSVPRPVRLATACRRYREHFDRDAPAPHGLRKTMSTHMARLGVLTEIRERCQGHKQLGVQDSIYNQYEYYDERRDAFLKWENELMRLVQSAEGK